MLIFFILYLIDSIRTKYVLILREGISFGFEGKAMSTKELVTGTKVKLNKKLLERPIGSTGTVTEFIDPTFIVHWDDQLRGNLDYAELSPDFVDVIETQSTTSLTIDYQTHFGNSELGNLAIATRNNFLQFARNTLDQLVKVGRELIGIREQTIETLGIKEGKRAFKQWLDSEEFGGTRYLAECAIKVASWFDELPPDTQEKVRNNAQDWSASALRELPKLTTSILDQLLDEGHQTVQSIKAKTPRKLSNPPINPETLNIGESLVFSPVEPTHDEQLDNLIGCEVELLEILENENVMIRHLDQPEQTYVCRLDELKKPKLSITQLEQQIQELKQQNQQLISQIENYQLSSETSPEINQSTELESLKTKCDRYQLELQQLQQKSIPSLLTNEQLYVGAKVVISHCCKGWQGYTGEITERSRTGDWWVKLDTDNGFIRNLYTASQLDWYIQTTKKTPLELKLEAENERLKGRLERLNLSQKEEQTKIKTISQILTQLGKEKGLSPWYEDVYRSSDGKTHLSFMDSLVAFFQDFFSPNLQIA
jgi:hypothetical protein